MQAQIAELPTDLSPVPPGSPHNWMLILVVRFGREHLTSLSNCPPLPEVALRDDVGQHSLARLLYSRHPTVRQRPCPSALNTTMPRPPCPATNLQHLGQGGRRGCEVKLGELPFRATPHVGHPPHVGLAAKGVANWLADIIVYPWPYRSCTW